MWYRLTKYLQSKCMSGWMDGWFQPSANVVSVLPNNSCQSDSSFFQGEKSMNMFKVVITAPKTLSQIPIRLHQVNNIIADVFGTLPLNLFFFLIGRIPDDSKAFLVLVIHREPVISSLIISQPIFPEALFFCASLIQPLLTKSGLRALEYDNAPFHSSIKS